MTDSVFSNYLHHFRQNLLSSQRSVQRQISGVFGQEFFVINYCLVVKDHFYRFIIQYFINDSRGSWQFLKGILFKNIPV